MPRELSPVSTLRGEVWKAVPGFESRYSVSNFGRVKSVPFEDRLGRHHKGGLLSQIWDGRYFGLKLSVDGVVITIRVHQLVLLAFRGPPKPGQECRHKNDDQRNNRLTNLRYGSSKQNSDDQRKNKGFRRGSAHQNTILTDEQVAEIRALPAGHKGFNVIEAWARKNGVSKGHVYNIRSRHRR